MLSPGKVQERFPKSYSKVVNYLLKLEGTIQGKSIIIAICPTIEKNHISNNLANQLLVSDSNLIEKRYILMVISNMKLQTYN